MWIISEIGFIGGGRITRLLLTALSKKQALPDTILISDPDEATLRKALAIAPDRILSRSGKNAVATADVIFLAVHPPVVASVAADIRNQLGDRSILVSLVPGISSRKLSELLDGFSRIVRMIPNAPSIMHQGYNPVAFFPEIAENQKTQLLSLFSHWGHIVEVAERKLEAYAVLTGMGPTYFWFQWLELDRLGESFGLSPAELKPALAGMLHGAAETLFNSNMTVTDVLDLLPGYPLKKHEADICGMLNETVSSLFAKLAAK